jgi:two-component system sensor histidine kinase UhpB
MASNHGETMSPYLFVNTFLIGFFGFAALHYFWLWCLSRREFVLLVFAVHCVLCASIGPFVIVIATASTGTDCQPALDARTTIGLLTQVSTVWIFALVTEIRAPWFSISVSTVFLLVAAINVFIVPINGVVTGLDRMHTWWGEEITVPRHTAWRWWSQPVFGLIISVYVFGLIGAARLWIRDRVGGLLVGLAAGIGLIKLAEPVAVDLFQVRLPYAGSLPEPVFVVLIAVLLSREYRLRGERLAAGADALAISEARYRTLTESAPEAVVVLDVERGTFADFNRKACELFGFSAEALRSLGPLQLSPLRQPDGRQSSEAAAEYIRQAVAYARPVFEWTYRTADGHEYPCEVRLVRLPDPSRVLLRGSVTDIKERKRAEAALRESEERFRNAFDFAAIGMALVAPDGRFLRVNQALCDMVGYSAAELLARDFQSITHPDDLEEDLGLARQILKDSLPFYHLEKRYLHKEGRIVWALLSVSLLRGRHAEPLYFISQIEDITERKNAEKTLQAYNLRLKALSHQILGTQETERRRLARELHDEIGQMLTAVGLRLHQLKTVCGAGAEAVLNEDIAFVNRAIEEVRELSLNLRPPMLDVLGLEAALRWYAQNQSQRSGLDVRLLGHLNVPRLDPNLEIACFRVVQESTTNVLRHAQARHVWIELQEEDTELNVVIRDDGVGFDVAEMHKRAGCGGSFGILAMRERIDLLGGRLEIESAPGQGTRVCARFPLNGTGTPTESSS